MLNKKKKLSYILENTVVATEKTDFLTLQWLPKAGYGGHPRVK